MKNERIKKESPSLGFTDEELTEACGEAREQMDSALMAEATAGHRFSEEFTDKMDALFSRLEKKRGFRKAAVFASSMAAVLCLVIGARIYVSAGAQQIPDTFFTFETGKYGTFISGQTELDHQLARQAFDAEYYQEMFDASPEMKFLGYSKAEDRQVQVNVHPGSLLCSIAEGAEYAPQDVLPAEIWELKSEVPMDYDCRVESHNGTTYFIMSGILDLSNYDPAESYAQSSEHDEITVVEEKGPYCGLVCAFCQCEEGLVEIAIVDYKNGDISDMLKTLDRFTHSQE